MTPPKLAVVGYVNMGKSSLVAALAEADHIEISPKGGTTQHCQEFICQLDGRHLFTLIDTPGFQAPRRLLSWIESWKSDHPNSTGPEAIRAFLSESHDQDLLQHEARLLQPIMEGAGILYVVDADVPYRDRHEAEMCILAMTGQPRMGIINLHQQNLNQDKWKDALSPHFSKVYAIDVFRAQFNQRIALIEAFKGINDDWAQSFEDSIQFMKDFEDLRKRRCAEIISLFLTKALSEEASIPLNKNRLRSVLEQELKEKIKKKLTRLEEQCRKDIEALFQYHHLNREENLPQVLEQDLFCEETWELLGLSKTKIISLTTTASAILGGLIDLKLGGLSFGTGTLLGGAVGLMGGLAATQMDWSFKVLGQSPMGDPQRLQVCPPNNLKWMSILLDRALIHYQNLYHRSHANRNPLQIHQGSLSIIEHLDQSWQKKFSQSISKWIKSPQANHSENFEALSMLILESLKTIASMEIPDTHQDKD